MSSGCSRCTVARYLGDLPRGEHMPLLSVLCVQDAARPPSGRWRVVGAEGGSHDPCRSGRQRSGQAAPQGAAFLVP
jgi:hypothetical protein